jgi:uncharacterized membrane protein YdjX (TVP38/TMEM64 family)
LPYSPPPIIAFFALDGPQYLDLDTIKANRDALLAFTESHYWLALTCAFVIYVTAACAQLARGSGDDADDRLPLRPLGRYGSGRGGGDDRCDTRVPCRALPVRDAARRRMGELGARINAGFTENAFSYVLFLRIVPFPFVLVNLALAFTDIKLGTYVLATLIGMVPGTFVFVNLGQTLGRIESTRQLLSLETLVAFTLLGSLALLPVLLKRWKPGLGPKP